MTAIPERVAGHNERQRAYFERNPKPGMVPRSSEYLRRHVAAALDAGGWRPSDRVLELGCGLGRYTFLLAESGVRVEGLDLSPVLLARLAAYNADRYDIPLHCADVAAAPASLDGAFDLVLGFFVLHHVHDLESCFRGTARLLKPGGRAVFLEPNPFNPLYYVQMAVTPGMTWAGDKGILSMRRGPVFRAMGGAGFRSISVTRFGFFPPVLVDRFKAGALERCLDRIPPLRPVAAFQIFRAELS